MQTVASTIIAGSSAHRLPRGVAEKSGGAVGSAGINPQRGGDPVSVIGLHVPNVPDHFRWDDRVSGCFPQPTSSYPRWNLISTVFCESNPMGGTHAFGSSHEWFFHSEGVRR
jgi:hypothetical protein